MHSLFIRNVDNAIHVDNADVRVLSPPFSDPFSEAQLLFMRAKFNLQSCTLHRNIVLLSIIALMLTFHLFHLRSSRQIDSVKYLFLVQINAMHRNTTYIFLLVLNKYR